MAELQGQVAEYEGELAESTRSLTEVRRQVEKQMAGRKAAERSAKEAETRLNGMLSAKDRVDDDTQQRLEVLGLLPCAHRLPHCDAPERHAVCVRPQRRSQQRLEVQCHMPCFEA